MRALALLAAITMVLTAHALPRPELAASQGVDDLRNERHIFHHLDRNPRTANRNRERLHGSSGEAPGLSIIKRLPDKPQQAERWMTAMTRDEVVDKRFMQDPDYSQGGSDRNGSNSAVSHTHTIPTQQPPTKAEKTVRTEP